MERVELAVTHLCSWYPSRVDEQNGNFIQRHVEAIAAHIPCTVIYAVSDPSITEIGLSENHQENLLEIIAYFPKQSGPWKRYRAHRAASEAAVARALQLRPYIADARVSLLHMHVAHPVGLYARELSKRWGQALIMTEHSTVLLPSRKSDMAWWRQRLFSYVGRDLHHVCPVSKDLGDAIRRLGIAAPQTVIPNVVDTSIFLVKEERSDGIFRWIHVSTLADDHKNVSGILRAFARSVRHDARQSLTLIGNAHQTQHRMTCSDLGLSSEQVRILTEQPIEQVAQEMRRHDAFILFSNYENLPCVISEAHCCGLPVIATDVGGVKEMIDKHNGLVITAQDEQELVDTMADLRTRSWDAATIRDRAVQRYSYDAVASQYLDIYRQSIR